MRKRFVLLWTPLVIATALMLPSAAAAASVGAFGVTGGYCSGNNTVHATFKLVKYSGFYATKLTISAQGQGFHNGSWRNENNFGTYTKTVNTSAKTSMMRSFTYNPGHGGKHRIHSVGKIWNGSQLVGRKGANTPSCT